MGMWVKEGKRGSLGHVGRDRYVTQQYVLILSNCGARVGELCYVRWNDIQTTTLDDGTKRLYASVKGKTGERKVVFNEGADRYVKNLYDMRKKELGGDVPYDGFVICKRDGTPIGSMKKGFTSVIQFCGLEFNNKGERRILYSLRHFYATQRLSEEVSPYMLASNMGTSVEMLERFYGHVVNDLVVAEITKTKRNIKPPKVGTNNYPFEPKN
jgi:integrase